MIRRYSLASFHVDSTQGPNGTKIDYTLVFNERSEMRVEECRTYNDPFQADTVLQIESKQFDNYSVEGVPLRELVRKKLEQILPEKEIHQNGR